MKKIWSIILFIAAFFMFIGALGAFAEDKPGDMSAACVAIVFTICLIIWGCRGLDKAWALKISGKAIGGVVFAAFCIGIVWNMDNKEEPSTTQAPVASTPAVKVQTAQPAPKAEPVGFDKLESNFLRKLRELEISPKVDLIGSTKSYSTDLSTLQIYDYPSVNSAVVMMMPASDAPVENLKSFSLAGAYVMTVVHKDAASKLISTITASLKSGETKTFIMNGYNITVAPPEKGSALPMIVMEVKKV